MLATGGFPGEYALIRALDGVGHYTGAAVSSIAFALPHAAVDGNVRRVVMRLTGSADADVPDEATKLMDRQNPGRSNQALMELGGVICLPARPLCRECPVRTSCEAAKQGTQESLPPPRRKPAAVSK